MYIYICIYIYVYNNICYTYTDVQLELELLINDAVTQTEGTLDTLVTLHGRDRETAYAL
jgi:hypothetical protein